MFGLQKVVEQVRESRCAITSHSLLILNYTLDYDFVLKVLTFLAVHECILHKLLTGSHSGLKLSRTRLHTVSQMKIACFTEREL